MTVRNLDALLKPQSVAVIGASPREGAVGGSIVRNLRAGGFAGPIWPVNPKHMSVDNLTCYPDVASLPGAPSVGVICTPPETVPQLVTDLGVRGTKSAIVITAGFKEMPGAGGAALEQAMLDAARPHLLRIVGPNCLGVIATPVAFNASFAPGNARKGTVAFVAQSGAMVSTVLDWASARGIGFSHLVALGDMADVDFGDMLDWLASDSQTHAILLYIEAVTSPRKFMSAARAASRLKPVIAIKAGRHEGAAKAATSHTGALAGADAVYDAAFERAGILRVRDLDELFDSVETVALGRSAMGEGVTILTNGGGVGVLAADAVQDCRLNLTPVSSETIAALDKVLPPTWSRGNPVDIIGDASPERYAAALSAVASAPETEAILVLHCPTAIATGSAVAQAVAATAKDCGKPVLTAWLGGGDAEPARAIFADARIPTFDTPTEAVVGLSHLVRIRRGQEAIMEVPATRTDAFAADSAAAIAVMTDAISRGKKWLAPAEVWKLLDCYGIAHVRSAIAATPQEAARRAAEIGTQVALKIVSPDIVHKSDVGGVALNLAPAVVEQAAVAMLRTVKQHVPNARITGFAIEEMIHRSGAIELIAGMAVDRQFGPFLLFGQGGTAVEVVADKAIALPPLNERLARRMIANTRVSRLLAGYRDQPPANLDAIASVLVRLSRLVCELDDVAEIEINPLLADAAGVVGVDARVRVERNAQRGHARLTIRPYPAELEHAVTLPRVGAVTIRPIRPEDASALVEFFRCLDAEDIRHRFFIPMRSLEPRQLARLTQIDYDREMALVALSEGRIAGVTHLIADPDNERAEFAITVRSDLKRHGLGQLLLTDLLAYARTRNIGAVFGNILRDNEPMLALATRLGFQREAWTDGDAVRMTRRLS